MKNDIDFYKLSNGKLGAINFNNMIPVPDGSYTLIGTKTQSLTYQEQKYKALLRNQLRWLNPDGEKLRDIASNLYMNRINNTLPFRVQKRCCDFQLLEEKCREYTKMISTKSFQELEYDELHSEDEDRFRILGCSDKGNILLVVHCIRNESIIRIISSRRATANEKAGYERSLKP